MKKNLAVLLVALTSSAAMAHDDGYNLEIDYNSHQTKQVETTPTGESFSYKNSTTNWMFTYYFDTISTTTGPLAEAAFLSRASSLSLPASGNEQSLGFEYFSQDSDFYVRLQNEENIHDKLDFGWMVDTHWLVAFNASYGDFNGLSLGIYTKKVLSLDNGDFLNVKLGYDKGRYAETFGGHTKQYYLDMDYYLGQDLSAGFSLTHQNDSKYTAEYRAQWFVTDGLSLGLSYTNGTADQPGYLHDSSATSYRVDNVLSAKVKLRF